jgi:hypothetical protein
MFPLIPLPIKEAVAMVKLLDVKDGDIGFH